MHAKLRRYGLLALCLGLSARADIYTVTTTNDDGAGSLRSAITQANGHAGLDEIQFAISGTPPFTIFPTNGLPAVFDAVTIDSTTQAGYTGAPLVFINGAAVPSSPGLSVQAANCTVRGLGILNCAYGVWLIANSNVVTSCRIWSNALDGIYLLNASFCTIGGTQALAGNVLSANAGSGIDFSSGAHDNDVLGNRIGTDPAGATAWGNASSGIYLGGPSNRIGSLNAGGGNVIAGNIGAGVFITQSAAAGNLVEGNRIGTDAAGLASLSSNVDYGIQLQYCGPGNRIAGNLISGSGSSLPSGSGIDGLGCADLAIQGNVIGLAATGTNGLSNRAGISLAQCSSVLIGGSNASQRNVVSSNTMNGIQVTGCTNIFITGNYIGTATNGLSRMGNGDGVSIQGGCTNIFIGSTNAAGRNLISANGGNGISAFSPATIIGNTIGLAVDGSPLGNMGHGVFVFGTNIVIGAAGAGNVIADSYYDGIRIQSDYCKVQGNSIGVDAAGTNGVGNYEHGIAFYGGGYATIGGAGAGEGNVIGDNFQAGIYMRTGTSHNVVQGNWIGKAPNGIAFPNWIGINIENSSSNTIGGTGAGEGNAIWYNTQEGLRMTNNAAGSAVANAILGNTFWSNGVLAIDLQNDGVTTNDTGDADTGSNNRQNYPVLTNAWAGSTHIQGTLNSAASRTYRLEFFASPTNDAAGSVSEGAVFVGTTNVTTDGSGNASFSALFPRSTPTGWVITATATDPGQNTSEFSLSRAVTKAPDVDANGIADYWETLYFGSTIGAAATNDPDGDGFSTRAEYLADTHPTNGTAFPRIQSASMLAGCTLAFSSSVGRVYTMQRVAQLGTQAWQDVAGQVDLPGENGPDALSDTNRDGCYEYRIRARLP